MLQFRTLSNTFDEESNLGPIKVDRVKFIKKRFDNQFEKLDKLGVDMPKSVVNENELCDLLHKTKDMTREKA